jgi:hypothetical protein
MKVFTESTRPPGRATEVVAGHGVVITLGIAGTSALRRPRESSRHRGWRSDGFFTVPAGNSLHAVTGSHTLTSPVSGAVVPGAGKLTCSAISQSRLGR